jgi:uncharacterized membrane protein
MPLQVGSFCSSEVAPRYVACVSDALVNCLFMIPKVFSMRVGYGTRFAGVVGVLLQVIAGHVSK